MKIRNNKTGLAILALLATLSFGACDDDEVRVPPTAGDAAPLADAASGAGDAAVADDGAVGDATMADAYVAGPCDPVDPNVYPSADFAANTVAEMQILANLKALNAKMEAAERAVAADPAPVPATKEELDALFVAGTPSLKDVMAPAFAKLLQDPGGIFEQFDAASGRVWAPAEPPPATGGFYAGHTFSATGVDLRQVVEKGSYSAALYNHALKLLTHPTLTPATIDRLVAILGTTPAFPNDDSAMSAPDAYIAKYTERRSSKTDAASVYASMKRAFIDARAAASKGETCNVQLQSAVATIKKRFEDSLAGTALFYANDGQKKLNAANGDPAKLDAALHSIGEGYAFVWGLRGLTYPGRVITDVQVDEILALFNVPQGGAAVPYKFATGLAEVSKLPTIVAKIQAVYGWSDAQVEGFKINN